MKIEHVAIWVADIERAKDFYTRYFEGVANDKYVNETKGFASYFITYPSGARLEVMTRTDVTAQKETAMLGWAHIAFSLGSKERVDSLTKELEGAGYTLESGPRTTGDGYYESVILDSEGNQVEITA
ncbi:glyoxalase/bleomycin resistance/extradiol dioxygenase family protein [Listeria booriae]|uniref:Glyoxalase/bleomycin resistance/extradiol dioxygenase family protein n=1 Tax=Listeria booriae TaxID=1552123 RepID=A0A7X1CXF9_9LIST|nr:VOC family protein [Listeria booriae]MBC1890340.1 glyoxalase/bleomycin resistance/extradiol dioxygenase family protein [Listeria booriae]MBC2003244.1 glyoxalase/bleomycin resistance/extradiol dioxygenase family protein [Listeria booriae]MBC2104959.1 glyoxalase/bleomycin resistance/extradiol dioxygenase family protein [Listeria booriae]MBC2115209.1 glyoxalase/bleomycin resistance/extradiol dioxygenase family protein [Listeria booriae]